MKILRIVLMGMLPLVCIFGVERSSFAFHNGGVGPCEGCHSMHNSYQGSPVGGNLLPNSYLLRQQDPSSTCLNCHQRAGDIGPTTYHISTPVNELLQGIPPKQLTPGGDFGWLVKTFSWTPGSGLPTEFSRGERHGHNIVAMDFLYEADSTYATAPGGTYPGDRLSCTSCHDPHGQYRRFAGGAISTTGLPIVNSGSFSNSADPVSGVSSVGAYRMLGGQGYRPKSLVGSLSFVYDPPAAVAPAYPNRSEAVTQTRVAYGVGMSEWCRNCHPDMHTAAYPGTANLLHPSGNTAKLSSVKVDNYNKYIRTGDLSGLFETSYLSLVPFEEGTADYATLKSHAKTDDTLLAGPDSASQVSCLTCHRAHASGWDGIMRWNTHTEYIVYNGRYSEEGQIYQPYGQGRAEAEATRAYYDRPAPAAGGTTFAPIQDSLCNKCHVGVYP